MKTLKTTIKYFIRIKIKIGSYELFIFRNNRTMIYENTKPVVAAIVKLFRFNHL